MAREFDFTELADMATSYHNAKVSSRWYQAQKRIERHVVFTDVLVAAYLVDARFFDGRYAWSGSENGWLAQVCKCTPRHSDDYHADRRHVWTEASEEEVKYIVVDMILENYVHARNYDDESQAVAGQWAAAQSAERINGIIDVLATMLHESRAYPGQSVDDDTCNFGNGGSVYFIS